MGHVLTGEIGARHSKPGHVSPGAPTTDRATVTQAAKGRHRIRDDGLDRLELYVGQNGAPDFSSSPDAQGASPLTTTLAAPGSGTRTYRVTTRKRNAYDEASQNTISDGTDDASFKITIDANGDEVATPPTAPQDASAAARAGGVVRIEAAYPWPQDDESDRADTWAIWITTDGSTPDVSTAPDATVSMVFAEGMATLSYDTAAQADGATVKARVAARRTVSGGSDVDSDATDTVSATANTDGPGAPDTRLFSQGDVVIR